MEVKRYKILYRQMKVLIINTFYYPNLVGGCEHSVKLLAENLAKQSNLEVAVYSIDSKKATLEIQSINGVKIYRGTGGYFNAVERLKPIKQRRFFVKACNFVIELHNLSIKMELEKVLEDFDPDVVHTNNIFGFSPLIWQIIKERKIRIVHTLRDYWLLSPSCDVDTLKDANLFTKIFFQLRLKWMRKMCTNYVDVVTAPSNATLNIFKQYGFFGKSELIRVFNAIEIDYEELYHQKKDKLNKTDDNFIYLFVGNLYRNKGILNLIYAFSELKLNNCKLYVVGNGPLYNEIQELTKNNENIILFGKKSQEELKQIFKTADIMVVPSLWQEPFGRVVIEASLNMLPVIGSDKGGIPEILTQLQSGIVFKGEDLEDLKNKMLFFYQNRNFKQFYCNIEKNIKIFSINSQILQFIDIYKNVNI